MAGVSSPAKTFTPKQGQYLAFIQLYTRLHRRPPAETDMQEYFRSQPASVHRMVLTLETGSEAAHHAILLRHLRANARSSSLPDDGDREWLERARCGEFSSMPEEFDWDRSTFFAHLIDGYRLAQQEGLGDLQDFYWTILAEAERTGTWSGTTLELWLALFAAHRVIRHGGHEPGANIDAGSMNSATP